MIVQSLPYQVELMNKTLSFSEYDTSVTAHVFFDQIYGPTAPQVLRNLTIGLPGTISKIFSDEERQSNNPILKKTVTDSVVSISNNQMSTVWKLRDRITIDFEQETGVIMLTAEMPDSKAAAEIGQAGITLLKDYLKEYRTEKAQKNLTFVQEQLKEVKKRFEEAQTRLAEFRDSNVNLATAKARTREQELQSEYDLTFNLYNSLSQRLEEAKLRLQEETPVFSVLQPITVPLGNSKPRSFIIIFGFAFLGLIIGLTWMLIDGLWHKAKVRYLN